MSQPSNCAYYPATVLLSHNLSSTSNGNITAPTRQRAFAAAAPSGKKSSPLRDILSGTAGGIAQVGAGHPLDTLKVRLQTQVPGPDGKLPFSGMGDCIRKTIALEGYSGLYKGAASPLIGSMAHNAGVFFSYGQAKKIVGADQTGAPLFKHYQAGALAAVFITCVESPVDLLKIKLQAQVGEGEYKGVMDAAKKITKQHGIKGIYQGFVPTMVRNIPCFGFYFAGSEFGYRLVCPVGEVHSQQQVFVGGMVGGACAGFGFWGLVYPLETIKTRMQNDKIAVADRAYKGMLDCAKKTYAEGGVKAFWKGYTPSLVRAVPVNSAIFMAVFQVKSLME